MDVYKQAYESLIETIERADYFESSALLSTINTNERYIKEISELNEVQIAIAKAKETEDAPKKVDPFEMIAQKYNK